MADSARRPPSPQTPRATTRRRSRRRAILAGLLAAVALLLVAGGSLTCRPAWYQPRSIDYRRLDEDKRAELRLENTISAALNAGRPVTIELGQQQVNRWIAAREQLWPGEVPSLAPFHAPVLVFLDDNRIRAGALAEQGGLRLILSVTVRLELTDDGLEVVWEGARAGLLPIPRSLIDRLARGLSDRLDLPPNALRNGRLKLPSRATWPNGERRFRIAELSIRAGTLRARLEPL